MPDAPSSTPSPQQLAAALAESCHQLADLAEQLTPEQWSLPTGCPGWTVHDQVAHIGSLESVFAGRPEPEHTAPEAAHVRNSIGRRVEDLVDRRRPWPAAEVVAELREVTAARVEQLAPLLDDGDATLPGPTGKPLPVPLHLSLRVFDAVAHEQDVRRAIGRPGGLDGAAGQAIAALLPALLSRGWEHGGAVALVVDGATSVLPLGTTEEPVATVTCPLADLVALCAGRTDAPAPVVDGDAQVAGRLVAALGVTP